MSNEYELSHMQKNIDYINTRLDKIERKYDNLIFGILIAVAVLAPIVSEIIFRLFRV